MVLLMRRNSKENAVVYYNDLVYTLQVGCTLTSTVSRLSMFIVYCVIINSADLFSCHIVSNFHTLKLHSKMQEAWWMNHKVMGKVPLCCADCIWIKFFMIFGLAPLILWQWCVSQALGNVLPPPAETMQQFSNTIGDLLLKYRLTKLLRSKLLMFITNFDISD